MAKVFKLGVLRARHDASVPYVSDQACSEMFFGNSDETAVCQYWSSNTDLHLDFSGSELLPWVDIALTWETVHDRAAMASHVYDSTVALTGNPGKLSGYHGYVVLLSPGGMVSVANPRAAEPGQAPTIALGFDVGARAFGAGKLAAVLPMTSDHTLCCHEVGHVLGFAHSYGALNNGIDADGLAPWEEAEEYGDPYDIMSSGTFGTRDGRWRGAPTFAGTALAAWPHANAFNTMGPAPARAQVHMWDKNAFAGQRARCIRSPGPGQSIPARIFRASDSGQGTTLLVISPPNEGPDTVGRCFVEYRDASGWDRGLDTSGTDLARRAVVVHAIAPVENSSAHCWYRGRILVPVESVPDLRVPDAQTVVTVVGVSAMLDYVDVVLTASAAQSLRVVQYVRDDMVGLVGEETHRQTACGRVRYGTYQIQRTSRFDVSTTGYGGLGEPGAAGPVIAWRVGTSAIAGVSGVVGARTQDGRYVVIRYDVDASSRNLTLTSSPSDAAYSVTVTCIVAEPGGAGRLESHTRFSPIGEYTGAHRLDQTLLEECMRRVVQRLLLRPRDFLIPPGPPGFSEDDFNRVNRARLEQVIRRASKTDRQTAADLQLLGDLRYGPVR